MPPTPLRAEVGGSGVGFPSGSAPESWCWLGDLEHPHSGFSSGSGERAYLIGEPEKDDVYKAPGVQWRPFPVLSTAVCLRPGGRLLDHLCSKPAPDWPISGRVASKAQHPLLGTFPPQAATPSLCSQLPSLGLPRGVLFLVSRMALGLSSCVGRDVRHSSHPINNTAPPGLGDQCLCFPQMSPGSWERAPPRNPSLTTAHGHSTLATGPPKSEGRLSPAAGP